MDSTPRLHFTVKVATDYSQVADIVDLINEAYEFGESGLWISGKKRVRNEEEVRELLKRGRVIIVVTPGKQEKIVGVVCVKSADKNTGMISMLSCHKDYLSQGVGNTLVESAEQLSKELGFKEVRMMLFQPKYFKHPFKERLRKWYTKLGYTSGQPEPIPKDIMDIVRPLFAVECEMTVFCKQL